MGVVLLVERFLGSHAVRWTVLATAVVGAFVLTFVWGGFPAPYRIDLDVYRTGAQVFLEGGSIYGPMPELAEGARLPFTYPPIAAALFTVFAVMPLWAASTLLTVVSLGALALTLRIMLSGVSGRPRAEQWWLVAGAMAVGLWFGPVRETLTFGQINIVLMALVVVDAVRGRGRWWGGALIGLAIAIKLTPAVFLLLFLLRRDWRGGVTTVVSFLVYSGIGHLLMPADSLKYWTETLSDTGRIGGAAYASNQSINAVLHRLGIESTLTWFVVAMIAGLLVAWVAWRLLKFGHDIAATVVVGFAALLCSPVSWGHHWVWTLPLTLLMLVWAARQPSGGTRWLSLVGVGAFIFLTTPQWWFPNTNDLELDWTPLEHVVGSSYLVWSLIALVTIGLSAHRVGRGDRIDTVSLNASLVLAAASGPSEDPAELAVDGAH